MLSVSILMPVYNAEPYLSEAIQSMLNQTYTDFELIILDDCSTDRSADVVQTFSDTRIVYHRNDVNYGLANNLNTGIKLAKGKYIARMDGDDISLPERIERQMQFLSIHPEVDLVGCWLKLFGDRDEVWHYRAYDNFIKNMFAPYQPPTLSEGFRQIFTVRT